jgi:hypothetical protein
MRRGLFRPVLAASLLVMVAACDSGNPATPVTPGPLPTVTDTFTGTLSVNGAMTYTFSSLGAGSLQATLKAVSPDSSIPVGFSVGVWNGTTCQITLANDNAFQGTVILGNINGSGTLCTRVHDVGKLVESASFEISVVHP